LVLDIARGDHPLGLILSVECVPGFDG
jgi:hypothetical protein